MSALGIALLVALAAIIIAMVLGAWAMMHAMSSEKANAVAGVALVFWCIAAIAAVVCMVLLAVRL